MHLSYFTKPYRSLVESAFSRFLLALRYTQPLPNIERFKQFLSQVKREDPLIMNTALCRDGLPDHWCYIQYTRSPLTYVENIDTQRTYKVRFPDDTAFQELQIGFGEVSLSFWLAGNNDDTIEECEVLYYRKLSRLKEYIAQYFDIQFTCEVEHLPLSEFGPIILEGDQSSGFSIAWQCVLRIPLILNDIQGHFITSIHNNFLSNDDILLYEQIIA